MISTIKGQDDVQVCFYQATYLLICYSLYYAATLQYVNMEKKVNLMHMASDIANGQIILQYS